MLIAESSTITRLAQSELLSLSIDLLREDELHPVVSGNKWRKLKYHLQKAEQLGKTRLLSWGGAFSNHLHALAWAGKELGFNTVGMLRGHEVDLDNPTLRDCRAWGMDLVPMERSLYACKHEACVQQDVQMEYPDAYLIPEGGGGYLGVAGCSEILPENDYEVIAVASGTGTTAAGLAMKLQDNQELWVFPANGNIHEAQALVRSAVWGQLMDDELTKEIMDRIRIWSDPGLGGFASLKKELLGFMNAFHAEYGIQLDSVYTGRMMYQLARMLPEVENADRQILAIHTGGLQGNRGMNNRLKSRGWEEIVG